ncbi:MAG: cyclic pyranopterin monophosphate synthase MoaC [Gammaproteobacteria bacterium]|nr:MAG: cyclic pyranopterin monophosphate synthase MoaC [Gammaproteobacteria bacterium]
MTDARDAAPLTHLDDAGRARMVDVSEKPVSRREAVARACVRMAPETLARIQEGDVAKGDVLAVARIAGIQAAKRTGDLIPLCHPLPLSAANVSFRAEPEAGVLWVEARCVIDARTGVEMEALTAVSIAALTVYDMCKAADRGMSIERVELLEKHGGRSGSWVRES